ncbi:MAG: glycosyltransferase family 39 protein [Chloroflexi bacterium]|nr:glycosyltransferase family 39 protein [Chloroflexota bacterium]
MWIAEAYRITHIEFPERYTKWLLPGLLLLALAVRVWGVKMGLPYLYHPDEPTYVAIAQNIFKTGDWNPHFFNYPSLFFYLNALAYLPYYLIGKLAGIFNSPADISAPTMITMGVGAAPLPSAILLERGLTVLFGCGSVLLIYFIGKYLFSSRLAALIAAFSMAVSSINVINSRLITPDTFLGFFILLSFWGSTLVFLKGKTGHYSLAGVAVGLVASTKYNGALIVLALLLAHFLREGSSGWKDKRLYLALFLGAVTFLLTTPFAIFDYQTFISDLTFEAQHYSVGHMGMEGDTFLWYLHYTYTSAGPMALFALLEVVRGIYIRSKSLIFLSFFPLLYFVFISSFEVRNDRTLLPLTPFLFLLGASFLVNVLRPLIMRQRVNRRLFTTGVTLLLVATLLYPVLQMLYDTGVFLTGANTREVARSWIARNVPSGSRIALESYSPYVDPSRFSVEGLIRLSDHPPEWYTSNGFNYLVFSKDMYGRFYDDRARYPDQVSQYDSLFKAFTLVEVVPDPRDEIRIYKVGGQ